MGASALKCSAADGCLRADGTIADSELDGVTKVFADPGTPLSSSKEGSTPLPSSPGPLPLWRRQAEEANARQRRQEEAAAVSDSDSNYSYEDDEDEEVLTRARGAVKTSQEPAQKQFDVEWHGLLSRMGGGFGMDNVVDEAVLRAEFNAMDVNGDGSLDIEELACVFENLGITVKPYKLANLMSLADTDSSGTIEWPEFCKIVKLGLSWQEVLKQLGKDLGRKRGAVLEYVLKKEFNNIDVDGNGSLDADEMLRLFKNLGIAMKEDLVGQLIAMADKDGNGTLEWEEFRKMFHVVNTVARLTRPRRNARDFTSGEAKKMRNIKMPRNSSIEWQSIIQDVGMQIKKQSTPVDEKSLKKQFTNMDLNGDGSLDNSELSTVFAKMGITLDDTKIANLVAVADDDGNNTIEWPEFKRMFDISMKWHEFLMKVAKAVAGVDGRLTDNVLRRQFLAIDKDNNGSLDLDELKQVFVNLKIDIDDGTLRKLLMLADGDGTGTIEWPEFRRMFQVVNGLAENKGSSPRGPPSPRGSKAKNRH